MLQQRQLVQHVRLDGLLKFRARQRLLQHFGEQLAKRAMLRRAGLLAVFPVKQADVDRLPDQVQQIFSRKIHEARAQKNVIMNVVNAQRQVAQPNFGGVRLQLHPGRMGGRRRNAGIWHPGAARRSNFHFIEGKCAAQWHGS